MYQIFTDECKINCFANIQINLCNLNNNANDDDIKELINEIPQIYLNDKENLEIVCELFAKYARNQPPSKKKNSIKLFDRIKPFMKTHLKGESAFFWKIFGGLYFFKYWMYEEGFISIEYIIQYIQRYNNIDDFQYFLPEIIEQEPEVFNKELKHLFNLPLSMDEILKFKEILSKHLKWIKESGDYNDHIYSEIEKNKLRLAIKRDDIDTFQHILSRTNLSINSEIKEFICDNFLIASSNMSLFEYAIYHEAQKIINFMIMNNVQLTRFVIFSSCETFNLDLIHFCELKMNSEFKGICLRCSISSWNENLTKYILDNYSEYNFLFEENVITTEIQSIIMDILEYTIKYTNFIIFKTFYFLF